MRRRSASRSSEGSTARHSAFCTRSATPALFAQRGTLTHFCCQQECSAAAQHRRVTASNGTFRANLFEVDKTNKRSAVAACLMSENVNSL